MATRRNAAKKEKNAEIVDWDAVGRLDEDCKELRDFKIKDKLKDHDLEEAKEGMVVNMSGKELTVEALQANGFAKPIVVSKRDDLGLKLPHREFTIDGIRKIIKMNNAYKNDIP